MTKPERILHFHFGKDGGAERFFVNLANAFGERGIAQRFAIRPRRAWRAEIDHLGPVIENDYSRLSPLSLVLEWQVRRLLRDWDPDVIMAWMPRAARLIPPGGRAFKIVRLGDFPKSIKHFGQCDVVVGNVPGIAQRTLDLGWKGEVATITNFAREVSPVRIDRALLSTPDDAFLVAGAGRFVPRKGMDLLLRAAARVPNAWVWLIGEGRERPALEALAADLGIADRVRFTGWLEEPVHHIAAADVFAMPSRHEPLGNSVLDAWRAGVPVVSTRSEGPAWYMRHEKNGLLTDIDDVEDFARQIARVRRAHKMRARIVQGGVDSLDGQFSKDRIVDQYLDLFARGRADR